MYYIFMIAGTCDLESSLEEVWHLGGTFKKKKTWKLIGENDSSQFTAVPSNSTRAKYSLGLHVCLSTESLYFILT